MLGVTVIITINNIDLPLSKRPDAETNIKLLSFPVSKMGKTKAKDTDTNMRRFDANILKTTQPKDSETHVKPNPNKTKRLEIRDACPLRSRQQVSKFNCRHLQYTGNPVSCQSDVTFYTRHDILEGLRSKWLFLIGDSTTRAMTLALMENLDESQTHPHDFQTWYNITDVDDEAAILGEYWRGRAADFSKLDFIFRRTSPGVWDIVYKKASCVHPWPDHKMTRTGREPRVFLPGRVVGPDEVRISYSFSRGARDVRTLWDDMIPGTPDIVYVNTGAWQQSKHGCHVDILKDISVRGSQLIWGTIQRPSYSQCDRKVLGLKHVEGSCILGTRPNTQWITSTGLRQVLVVDRSMILRTSLRDVLHLHGVHHTHVANLYDVMQMFKVLGWRQTAETSVQFSPFCVVNAVGMESLRLKYNITVTLPDQGWKSTWKLPCRYTVKHV